MEQEDWKDRYKSLSEEMETLQAQLDDRTLENLVCQMAVALDGHSAVLDRALVTLCKQLKAEEGTPPDTAKLVEKQLRGLDIEQQRNKDALLQGLHKWIYQLRLNLTTDLSNQRLSGVESSMEPFTGQVAQITALVNDLVSIQSSLLEDDLNGGKQAVTLDDLNHNDDEVLKLIGSELLIVMASLNVPKGEMSRARELTRRIEGGVTLPSLSIIIQDVVNLVASLNAQNSEEFEVYLRNLTGQLAEVQAFVEASQEDESVSGEAATLSSDIHQDVQAIQQAVLASNDLNQLKSNVSSQLLNIVKSVDLFKQKEEDREKRLHERYLQMNTRLEQMEKQTQYMKVHVEAERQKARTDALTSLPNRAGYDARVLAEFDRWTRYNHSFSLVVADLDLFKRINDTYGHQAGDKVLRLVASILSKKSRSTDFVSRYGGEEFVILMPGTSAQQAVLAVDKIRKAVEKSPFNFHGQPVQITLSLGVSEIQKGDSIEELFNRADKALYKAKKSGRNRIEQG